MRLYRSIRLEVLNKKAGSSNPVGLLSEAVSGVSTGARKGRAKLGDAIDSGLFLPEGGTDVQTAVT